MRLVCFLFIASLLNGTNRPPDPARSPAPLLLRSSAPLLPLALPHPPGGFRPQAQVAEEALRVLDQAQALQRAGCFALVLECIPGPIAAAITRSLTIPTIGIGAGGECSGQVGGAVWCRET